MVAVTASVLSSSADRRRYGAHPLRGHPCRPGLGGPAGLGGGGPAATQTWADLSGETHPTLVTTSNDLLGHQIAIAPADPLTLAWGNPKSAGLLRRRRHPAHARWRPDLVTRADRCRYRASPRLPRTRWPRCAVPRRPVSRSRWTLPTRCVLRRLRDGQGAPGCTTALVPGGYYTRDAGQTWLATRTG